MGVSYYSCDCCKNSRYEEYVHNCDNCQHDLCTSCLVNNDLNSDYAYNYAVKYDGSDEMKEKYGIEEEEEQWIKVGEIIDDAGIDPKYCPFCQGEKASREDVLNWYLNKEGLSYDSLKAEFMKEKFNK